MLRLRDDCQHVIENMHNFSDDKEIMIYMKDTGTDILYHLDKFQSLEFLYLEDFTNSMILSDPLCKTLLNCSKLKRLDITCGNNVQINDDFIDELQNILTIIIEHKNIEELGLYFGDTIKSTNQLFKLGDTIIKYIPLMQHIYMLKLGDVYFNNNIFDALEKNQQTLLFGENSIRFQLIINYIDFLKYSKQPNVESFNIVNCMLTFVDFNPFLNSGKLPEDCFLMAQLELIKKIRTGSITNTHRNDLMTPFWYSYIANGYRYQTTLTKLCDNYYRY